MMQVEMALVAEPEMMETMVYGNNIARPLILTSRCFRRNVSLGMKVWRSSTRNFDTNTQVEHIELACPAYTLTDRGPVLDRKKKEEVETKEAEETKAAREASAQMELELENG